MSRPTGSRAARDEIDHDLLAELQRLTQETCGLARGHTDPVLQDLARLAAVALRAPVAHVALVDRGEVWFPAHVGMGAEPTEVPRAVSFCTWAMRRPDQLLIVPDSMRAPRSAAHPLVSGDPHLRFYAGAPVRGLDGQPLGTLAVLDVVVREGLTAAEEELLRGLGRQVEQRLALLARSTRADEHERDLLRAERVGRTGSLSLDLRNGTWTWSPGMYVLAGLDPNDPRSVEQLREATFIDEEGRTAAASLIAEAVRTGETVRMRRQLRRADGTIRTCQGQGKVEHDAYGLARFRATLVDVTADAAVEAEVRRERSLLSGMLTQLAEGVVACDADGRLTLFNPAAEAFHGSSADPTVDVAGWSGRYDLRRVDGTPLPTDEIPLLRALRGEVIREVDIVIAPHGLPARTVSCNGQQLTDDEDRILGAVLTMVDVTERREQEARLRSAAARDPLTRLANRRTFDAALQEALAGPGADEVAVVFVDLDRFKMLNDTHGHAAGDQVLRQVAVLLQDQVRPGDVVSRRGGDEFAVLLTRADPAVTDRVTARIQRALDGSRRAAGTSLPMRATVGSAHRTAGPDLDAAGLLALADARMYAAKRDVAAQRMAPGR